MSEDHPVLFSCTAPAKINLALHIIGQRGDGYHLIDSLVTFAHFGDTLRFETAEKLELTLAGPQGKGLSAGEDNLIMRAARSLLAKAGRPGLGVLIELEKHLPVASGIGGGSANAAATLQGLNSFLHLGLSDSQLMEIGLTLGADVPMCLWGCGVRVRGIGERIVPTALPQRHMVLVNPRVPVSTPDVFMALTNKKNSEIPNDWAAKRWPDVLHELRNDLETPAVSLVPEIADCLNVLDGTQRCLISRMSGSGATCFGLYDSTEDAELAAVAIRDANPNWWVVSTQTIL